MIRSLFLNATVLMLGVTGIAGLVRPGSAYGAEQPKIEERKIEIIEEHQGPGHEKPKLEIKMDVNGNLHAPSVPSDFNLPPDVVQKLDGHELASVIRTHFEKPKSLAETIFNEATFVPAIFFTLMGCVSFMLVYFNYKKRRDFTETVRLAIQSGQTLPASYMESFEKKTQVSPDSDLRRAVLLITLGVSTSILLSALGVKELGRAWAIGCVPTMLGLGYLFLWRHSQKKVGSGSTDVER